MYAIPIVAASELGPALNSALINLYSRTRLERPAKDGESPVDEIFIEYPLFSPALRGKSTIEHVKFGRKNVEAQATTREDRLPRLHTLHDR